MKKTIKDLEIALLGIEMSREEVGEIVAIVAKLVNEKHAEELYATLVPETMKKLSTLTESEASQAINQDYLMATGQKAEDRLIDLVDELVEDVIARPNTYFQKKTTKS